MYCDCGYNFDTTELKPSVMIKNKKRNYIYAFILSTFWICAFHIPVLPVGMLLSYWKIFRVKNYKAILTILLAGIIGFMGTGIYVDIYKAIQVYGDRERYETITFGLNVGIGFDRIEYILSSDKKPEEIYMKKIF